MTLIADDSRKDGFWLGTRPKEIGAKDDLSVNAPDPAPWMFRGTLPDYEDFPYTYERTEDGTVFNVNGYIDEFHEKEAQWRPGQFLQAPPLFDVKAKVQLLTPGTELEQDDLIPTFQYIWSSETGVIALQAYPAFGETRIDALVLWAYYQGYQSVVEIVDVYDLNISAIELRMTEDVVWVSDDVNMMLRRWTFGYKHPISGLWIPLRPCIEVPNDPFVYSGPLEPIPSFYFNHGFSGLESSAHECKLIELAAASSSGNEVIGSCLWYDFEWIMPHQEPWEAWIAPAPVPLS